MMGIEDSYTAYCVDEAASMMLNLFDSATDEQRKLIKWSDRVNEDGMLKGSGNESALSGFLERFGGEVG